MEPFVNTQRRHIQIRDESIRRVRQLTRALAACLAIDVEEPFNRRPQAGHWVPIPQNG
jgi:hypothetical protein